MNELGSNKKAKYFNEAREAFVVECIGIPQISLRLGISEATLGKWRKSYSWDKEREDNRRCQKETPEMTREILERKIASLHAKDPDDIGCAEIDQLAKVYSILNKLDDRGNPFGLVLDFSSALHVKIKEAYPEIADELWSLIEEQLIKTREAQLNG